MVTAVAVLLATAVVSTFAAPQAEFSELLEQLLSSAETFNISEFLSTTDQSPSSPTPSGQTPSGTPSSVAGNPQCGRNEIFSACGSRCTMTCDNYNSFSCSLTGCRSGCFCRDGLVRNPRNHWRCVKPQNCHKRHDSGDSSSSSSSGSSGDSSDEDHHHHHHSKGMKKDKRSSKQDYSDEHYHKKDKSSSKPDHSNGHRHKKDNKGKGNSNQDHTKSNEHHHKKGGKRNNDDPSKKNDKKSRPGSKSPGSSKPK